MAVFTESTSKNILTAFLVFISFVYIYFKWTFYYWKRKGIEHVPASIPFGSSTKLLLQKTSFAVLFKDVYARYKAKGLRYVGFYLFTKPVLVILDIHLIKLILTDDFQHFTDHAFYVNEKDEPLTGHLFALRGQRWKYTRAKLTPTFTSGKMKMMFHTLVKCSNGLQDIMESTQRQGIAVNIKDAFSRYTTDVIGSCAFGLECNSFKDPNSEFRKCGYNFVNLSMYRAFIRFLALVSPDVLPALHLKFLSNELSEFIMKVVKETVDYRENNNVKRNDFMHLLIQLKNNVQISEDEDLDDLANRGGPTEKNTFTIEQLAAHALIFFVAGFETSSTTLSFCFFELATNADIQEKLRKEIKYVLEKHNHNITYEALMEMPYMDKCINETLRKYPAVPVLLRRCTKTYRIPESDVILEKGAIVFIPVLGLHHDPEYYPNPETFDPERFNVKNSTNRKQFIWLPFGEGPRMCIGLRFGLMQIKVALTIMLRDYRFTLNSRTTTPLIMSNISTVPTPRDGIWLDVETL